MVEVLVLPQSSFMRARPLSAFLNFACLSRCINQPTSYFHQRQQLSLPILKGLHGRAAGEYRAVKREGEEPMSKVEIPVDVQAALQRLYTEMPVPIRISIITTGAGGHVGTWMLATPGASKVLVELQSPYSPGAVRSLLGGEPPGSYCSAETAMALAKAAYRRAVELSLRGSEKGACLDVLGACRFLGVACSAAVVSSEPKKGDHRAHIAAFGDGGAVVQQYSLSLTKGARDRAAEDFAVSKALVGVLLQAADLHASPEGWVSRMDLGPPAPRSPTALEDRLISLPLDPNLHTDPLEALAHNCTGHVLFVPSQQEPSGLRAYPGIALPFPVLIYPGSFNPLHEGHRKLVAAAQARIQLLTSAAGDENGVPPPLPVIYELAALNADKGWVGSEVLRARLVQFSSSSAEGGSPVVLTRNPLFIDKAMRFPGAYFIIGADTVKRLVDVKYYGHSLENMVAALSEIKYLGCKFVVGGRVEAGRFVTLEDVLSGAPGLPQAIKDIFIGLSELEFRLDISSTEIRARSASPKAQQG